MGNEERNNKYIFFFILRNFGAGGRVGKREIIEKREEKKRESE